MLREPVHDLVIDADQGDTGLSQPRGNMAG
jgi:hypothetical protein